MGREPANWKLLHFDSWSDGRVADKSHYDRK